METTHTNPFSLSRIQKRRKSLRCVRDTRSAIGLVTHTLSPGKEAQRRYVIYLHMHGNILYLFLYRKIYFFMYNFTRLMKRYIYLYKPKFHDTCASFTVDRLDVAKLRRDSPEAKLQTKRLSSLSCE